MVSRAPCSYGALDEGRRVLTCSEGPFQVDLEGFIGVLLRDRASRGVFSHYELCAEMLVL